MSQTLPRSMGAILKAVSAAVRLVASEEIMPCYRKLSHQRKPDNTLYDEAFDNAQHALSKKLQAIINAPVLLETMEEVQKQLIWETSKEGIWCLCPIDNPANFVRGLPCFAVSVALLRDGKPVLGVVYDPVADDLFAAEQGKGAFLNGEKLPNKETAPTLDQALASINMHHLSDHLCVQLSKQSPFAEKRNFGGNALDWCYTATGRYDVYLHGEQSLWDYAAGWLILQESGGKVCSLQHDDFALGNIWQRSVIAAKDTALFNEWKHWLHTITNE